MTRRLLLAFLLLAACGQSSAGTADAAAQGQPARTERAIFAGGCFWSTERDMEAVPGVISAVSGLTGGRTANPTYEQSLRTDTGHREAVLVTYDPARISYAELVRRFLRTIDPTDAEGQFCDRGPGYRTAVFAMNPIQRREAMAAITEANRALGGRVVTPVINSGRFYPAGPEHQDYARRNSERYDRYRTGCRKDARLREVWGDQAAGH
ncbi:peptide-methionine (S)-S-oxide reductase MsrA [Sphingosinicella sp. LHD-64]|uniref:peptide-methionine (S)-S-oxide reductase MsrA n=1 Tax=Sphingosinicella sp. LHD-64 TaxID=3072139 RepID=UPI00280C77BB|nr:peptide-methionine (S)-S-oxide reductase MsrA [Sphingosinicella sp. LHD-64]MDQ8756589.1 peptide-methionine (S)-S-oxide reductase MsrA [Sphingosinicella sp. LHD-64]